MEKELDFLEKIWSCVREWQGLYNTWKDGAFADIKVRHEGLVLCTCAGGRLGYD